ncbi:hypothetical protein GUITHDRAFT_50836, partial [Guillardia theta CCMP2712]
KARGNALFAEGKYEEAVEAYTRALEASGQDQTLWSNRSAARLKLGHYGFALADALSCVHLAPRWAKSYFRLASAFLAAGRPVEAADNFRRALALSPTDATILTSLKACEEKSEGVRGRGYVYFWG